MLGIQLKGVKGVVEKGATVVLQLAHILYMCVISDSLVHFSVIKFR